MSSSKKSSKANGDVKRVETVSQGINKYYEAKLVKEKLLTLTPHQLDVVEDIFCPGNNKGNVEDIVEDARAKVSALEKLSEMDATPTKDPMRMDIDALIEYLRSVRATALEMPALHKFSPVKLGTLDKAMSKERFDKLCDRCQTSSRGAQLFHNRNTMEIVRFISFAEANHKKFVRGDFRAWLHEGDLGLQYKRFNELRDTYNALWQFPRFFDCNVPMQLLIHRHKDIVSYLSGHDDELAEWQDNLYDLGSVVIASKDVLNDLAGMYADRRSEAQDDTDERPSKRRRSSSLASSASSASSNDNDEAPSSRRRSKPARRSSPKSDVLPPLLTTLSSSPALSAQSNSTLSDLIGSAMDLLAIDDTNTSVHSDLITSDE